MPYLSGVLTGIVVTILVVFLIDHLEPESDTRDRCVRRSTKRPNLMTRITRTPARRRTLTPDSLRQSRRLHHHLTMGGELDWFPAPRLLASTHLTGSKGNRIYDIRTERSLPACDSDKLCAVDAWAS